jgi:hypothetical protein
LRRMTPPPMLKSTSEIWIASLDKIADHSGRLPAVAITQHHRKPPHA